MHEYDYYRRMRHCALSLLKLGSEGGAYVVLLVINFICVLKIKRHLFLVNEFIRVFHIGGSVYEYDTT